MPKNKWIFKNYYEERKKCNDWLNKTCEEFDIYLAKMNKVEIIPLCSFMEWIFVRKLKHLLGNSVE